MLHKLVLKNMKFRYMDYIFYLVSSILGVAGYITLSSYLNSLSTIVMRENIKILNNDISSLKGVSYFFLMISLFFIIYTFMNYSKKKSRDYAIFITLGEKKENIFIYITIEIITAYIVSMIVGSVIGTIFYYGSLYLLKVFDLYSYPVIMYPIKKYIFIYIIYFILYCISAVCVYINLKKTKVNDLLTETQRADTLDRIGWYRFVFGIILSILSLYIILVHQGDIIWRTIFSVLFISIGLYLLFVSMAFPILQLLRDEEELYYKNFLFINNFVFRFNRLSKIIYSSFLSGLILLIFVGANIFNGIYSNTVESYNLMYPNDFVTESYSKPSKLISELKNSGISMHTFSMEMTIIENSKNIGKIRCADIQQYNSFYNKDLKVKSKEVIGIALKLPEDFKAMDGANHISVVSKNGEEFHYTVKDTYWKNMFGVFEDYGNEYLLLMNREDYNNIKRYGEVKHYLFVNVKNRHDKSEIKQLLNTYESQKNKAEVKIYEKDKYVEINRNGILCMLLTVVFVGVIMMIFKNSVIYINTFSQIDYIAEKYKAYYIMGMNREKITHIATREYRLPFLIPVVLSCVLGGIYIYILSMLNSEQQREQIYVFFSILICGYIS